MFARTGSEKHGSISGGPTWNAGLVTPVLRSTVVQGFPKATNTKPWAWMLKLTSAHRLFALSQPTGSLEHTDFGSPFLGLRTWRFSRQDDKLF